MSGTRIGKAVLTSDDSIDVNTVNEHTADAGVTVEGLNIKDSLLQINGNQIIESNTDTDNSSIALNYCGYAGGVTRFRDVRVYNGKHSAFAKFDGSVPSFLINTINEHTADAGVTVDGVLCRDSGIVIATHTPASAGAAGVAGQIAWDANYVYVCTAANTWKRTAISTW